MDHQKGADGDRPQKHSPDVKAKGETTVWEGSEEARKRIREASGLRREHADPWRITNSCVSKTNALLATGEEHQIQHKIRKFSWVCLASLELRSQGLLLHALPSVFTKEVSNIGGLAVCCNFVNVTTFHLLVRFIPYIEPALSFKIKMWNLEWKIIVELRRQAIPKGRMMKEG